MGIQISRVGRPSSASAPAGAPANTPRPRAATFRATPNALDRGGWRLQRSGARMRDSTLNSPPSLPVCASYSEEAGPCTPAPERASTKRRRRAHKGLAGPTAGSAAVFAAAPPAADHRSGDPGSRRRPNVGGSAIALLWLLSGDLGATQCGAPSKPQLTTWNGRSGIWRHSYVVQIARLTAETTRIKLTRPSPRLVYHCNDANSRIQEGPRLRCTQARSLSARDGEESSRPASASEVDLDARLCADRRQSCNA